MPNPFANWTLFLDRDGVINDRLPGAYVRFPEEFQFAEGSLKALQQLATYFKRIIVVTNQQGIGKGLMTEEDLKKVHAYMLREVTRNGGRIEAVYFCPNLAKNNSPCRKPNPGMAHWAKADFADIDFAKSIIVGDSISDMNFGKPLGMKTVFVESKPEDVEQAIALQFDLRVKNLLEFAEQVEGFFSAL